MSLRVYRKSKYVDSWLVVEICSLPHRFSLVADLQHVTSNPFLHLFLAFFQASDFPTYFLISSRHSVRCLRGQIPSTHACLLLFCEFLHQQCHAGIVSDCVARVAVDPELVDGLNYARTRGEHAGSGGLGHECQCQGREVGY